MELVTTHVHTTFCNHAYGSVRQMVDAGATAGVTTMAITEHYPLTHRFDPTERVSMRQWRLSEYFQAIEQARAAHPDMEVLAGCELDWLGSTDDRGLTPQDFDRFEIVLGSVHYIDGWGIATTRSTGRRRASTTCGDGTSSCGARRPRPTGRSPSCRTRTW